MTENSSHTKRKINPILGIGIVAVILIAIGLILWSQSRTPTVSAERLAQDPSLGPASAKVTIIEYGDFGCPTCRGWEKSGVLQRIRATYGDQVHFVWRDYPIITAQSPKAAQAGQCAFDQGKFWEYHDLLYAKAPRLSVAHLKEYAAQIGLDTGKFDRCLDSDQYKAKVDQSMKEAQGYGFVGTPDFIVNGTKLIGPASFAKFKSVIDPLLSGG